MQARRLAMTVSDHVTSPAVQEEALKLKGMGEDFSQTFDYAFTDQMCKATFTLCKKKAVPVRVTYANGQKVDFDSISYENFREILRTKPT